ncbi:unspecific monooxygenase [Dictyocaulus viviparus]|uniref:Unspecific monooxygenase n=1 Tax=Dictyocaulus viviparus TaxID=29172 RepID=A0A0D8XKD5_DICVI|nr:unspecific monooxygenase [Dictyocaulus viviparus]
MGLITSIALVILIIISFYYVVKHLRLRKRLKGINSPRSYPLIGHATISKPDPEGFINQVMGMAYLYPDAPRMVLFWLGPMPIVMLYSAHLVEKILTSSNHLSKGFAYSLLEPWLGQGIITSNVDNWRPKRKMLTPTFHYDILKDFLPTFNEQSRVLVKRLASLPEGEPVELLSFITLCGLDIICETSMGKTINAQCNKESDYVWAVHTINDLVQERTKNPLMWNDFIYKNFGKGMLEKKCLDILHSFTRNVISERQKELEESEWRLHGRLAFLDLLLDMSHHGLLGLEDIHSQISISSFHTYLPSNFSAFFSILLKVDTLMFAGHDTTSTGASWALYLLGCYPEIQKKAQTEIDDVLADSDYISIEHLAQLKYESLRICPVVPMIMRELGSDQDIDGFVLPKGTQLIINQFMVHRDPMYWQDPEDFNPESSYVMACSSRFLPENIAGRHPFAFIPFSAGSRNCIGQRFLFYQFAVKDRARRSLYLLFIISKIQFFRKAYLMFAMMEEKVIVSWVLRHFNVTSMNERYNMKSKIGVILRPSNGIHVILDKRRPIV